MTRCEGARRWRRRPALCYLMWNVSVIPSLCLWWHGLHWNWHTSPVLLGLALLTYAGVRFLTEGCSGFSEGIVISNGWQWDALKATTLRDWRSSTSCRSRTSCTHPPRLHNGWMTWHSERRLRRVRWSTRRLRPALQLVRDLQEDKLAVASKSVVIATTPSIANQVVATLARHDIHIQEASQAKDLGLYVSSARTPMRRTMANRWAKAVRRTRRCARFGKWTSKQANARQWRTGAWARKACGAPPTWIKQARTRAAEAAQCGRGRCLTTTIALLHPKRRSSSSDPVQSHQALAYLLGAQSQNQAQDWKVWAKIATAMMARSPATRWRYVRDTCQLSSLRSCNTIGTPFGTHPRKTRKAKDGVSRLEVWELMIGDFGKPSELRLRGSCGRRLQGTSWEQVWMAGQISPRCSSMTSSWRRRACIQPRHAVGSGCSIVQGWWNRRCARDARKRNEDVHHRVWQCRANTGEILDKTQHLVHKATQAKDTLECFWFRGLVPRSWTFARHEVGFLPSIWEWRIDRSLYTHLWRRLGKRTAIRGSGAWVGLQLSFRVCQTVLNKPWSAGSDTVRGL